MKVASTAEMNLIDRLTQEDYNIPGAVLMERAALAIRQVIEDHFELAQKKVYIFCGKGNNGGDGLALARLLAETPAQVLIVLAADRTKYRGLALENIISAEKFGLLIVDWETIDSEKLQQADLIIDALLGTGSQGAPNDALASIITRINDSGKPVISVDIPSGIDVNDGRISGVAVKATITVTFGLPKPGQLIHPGAEMVGKLLIRPIGFPRKLLDSPLLKTNWINAPEISELLPQRPPTAHKGLAGHVLVIGGAIGMTGAVALCSLGALRSGAGLVTAGIQEQFVFPEKPAEVMTLSWDNISSFLDKANVVVFGPGLSIQEQSRNLLLELLHKCKVPLVIDADGLNLLAETSLLLPEFKIPVVLTPHPGEMSRLSGLTVAEIQENRIGVARRFAIERNVTLILKGARSIIADNEGNVFINPTGNKGMATAGMGDTLAGIVGGLLAQGTEQVKAAVIGTYLHGLAGDLAAKKLGPVGIVATDLLNEYPRALKKVLS